MAINKVIYAGETLIDLSNDTVTSNKLLKGYTAHAADGTLIVGTYLPTDYKEIRDNFENYEDIKQEFSDYESIIR